ncbi:unnamed protein product [Eruca vesicaria subsp. sativa]|uniref:RING-type E3 ubiquitin transferase n=1 Tax=Eruca vesicaria subsp. sativa TaxID=29727 RepID=A0ABC8J3A9_ERUVS|nr:unnamed protein product [Eruca vesicaria subsp. sativa]
MNAPEVEVSITGIKHSPSTPNKVVIMINTKFDEILENPTTGLRTPTGRSTLVSPPLLIYFDLCTTSLRDIEELLGDKLASHRWLCVDLASDISTFANELGFGFNGVTLTISVKLTYQNVVVVSDPAPDEGLSLRATILRIVLLGKIDREELKSLKMETESCSICLDNLSGSSSKRGAATRMNCSHVFHDLCILEWLQRKRTCPLCRTVLYD